MISQQTTEQEEAAAQGSVLDEAIRQLREQQDHRDHPQPPPPPAALGTPRRGTAHVPVMANCCSTGGNQAAARLRNQVTKKNY